MFITCAGGGTRAAQERPEPREPGLTTAAVDYFRSVEEHVERDGLGDVVLDGVVEGIIVAMVAAVPARLLELGLPAPYGEIAGLALVASGGALGFLHGLSGGYVEQRG